MSLKSVPANEKFNYGSVKFQLNWQEFSQVSKLSQDKPVVQNPIKVYHDFLAEKMRLSFENFHPSKLEYLAGAQDWYNFN